MGCPQYREVCQPEILFIFRGFKEKEDIVKSTSTVKANALHKFSKREVCTTVTHIASVECPGIIGGQDQFW